MPEPLATFFLAFLFLAASAAAAADTCQTTRCTDGSVCVGFAYEICVNATNNATYNGKICFPTAHCKTYTQSNGDLMLTLRGASPRTIYDFNWIIQAAVMNEYNKFCRVGENYKLCCPGATQWKNQSVEAAAKSAMTNATLEVPILSAIGSVDSTTLSVRLAPSSNSTLCAAVTYATTVTSTTVTSTTVTSTTATSTTATSTTATSTTATSKPATSMPATGTPATGTTASGMATMTSAMMMSSMASPMSPSMAPSMAPSGTQPMTSPMTSPMSPSGTPPMTPSMAPSMAPSGTPPMTSPMASPMTPSMAPSMAPSGTPPMTSPMASPMTPSMAPSMTPSMAPSMTPSMAPSMTPSGTPSMMPSTTPRANGTTGRRRRRDLADEERSVEIGDDDSEQSQLQLSRDRRATSSALTISLPASTIDSIVNSTNITGAVQTVLSERNVTVTVTVSAASTTGTTTAANLGKSAGVVEPNCGGIAHLAFSALAAFLIRRMT